MGKQSAFAKAVQREVNIQLQLYGRNRMQLAEDAAFMAANEVLGLAQAVHGHSARRLSDTQTRSLIW